MCFFLSIASPLTLSEIRSMLPSGLTADLAPSAERARLTRLHPSARTVAQLLVGACSCDLVRTRQESSLDDEPWKIDAREGRSRGMQAKVGDHALFFRKASVEITFEERKYLVVPQAAILVLVRDDLPI